MKRSTAPCWMEPILLLTLPPRTRESVAGDLHEEFHARLLQSGRLRANFWYARQVVSFLPHHAAAVFARSPALMMMCGFAGLCGLWLGAMGLRHPHPGLVESELISLIIVLQAAITIVALCYRPVTFVRRFSVCGTVGLAWLAWKALVGTLRGAHFEGYILLIAILLLVQAVLTMRSVPDWQSRRAG
jgi:hypothetical protein